MTINQVSDIQTGIIEHKGYCEVPSAHVAGQMYRVYVNSKLYSVSCNCKAGQAKRDCGHRLAVDRHFDDRRTLPVFQVSKTCDICGREMKSGYSICGRCIAG